MGAFRTVFLSGFTSGVAGAINLQINEYKQTLTDTKASDVYHIKQYVGVSPELVKRPKGVRTLTQTGYAIVYGARMKPPAPVLPAAALLAEATSTVEWNDVLTHRTSWTYVMAIGDDQLIDYAAWQAAPTTIEVYP